VEPAVVWGAAAVSAGAGPDMGLSGHAGRGRSWRWAASPSWRRGGAVLAMVLGRDSSAVAAAGCASTRKLQEGRDGGVDAAGCPRLRAV
jgi:hypothetical protein